MCNGLAVKMAYYITSLIRWQESNKYIVIFLKQQQQSFSRSICIKTKLVDQLIYKKKLDL